MNLIGKLILIYKVKHKAYISQKSHLFKIKLLAQHIDGTSLISSDISRSEVLKHLHVVHKHHITEFMKLIMAGKRSQRLIIKFV